MRAPFSFIKSSGGPPTLSSLNYVQGDIAGGGKSILATGTNCASVTAVTIGGNSATITGQTSTTVTFTLPVHASGAVAVSLTNPSGTSGTLAFTYWSPVQITGIDTYLDANKNWAPGASAVWTDQNSVRTWSQAVGISQPAQTASVFGTLPSLRFARTSPSYLDASVTRNFSATGSSAFFVQATTTNVTVATSAPFNVPMNAIGWLGGWDGFGLSGGDVALESYDSTGTTSTLLKSTSLSLNDGVARMLGATATTAGAATLYVGSSVQATGSSKAPFGYSRIGVGQGANDGYTGDIGAIVLVSGVITAGDLASLNAWSQQRFGTP